MGMGMGIGMGIGMAPCPILVLGIDISMGTASGLDADDAICEEDEEAEEEGEDGVRRCRSKEPVRMFRGYCSCNPSPPMTATDDDEGDDLEDLSLYAKCICGDTSDNISRSDITCSLTTGTAAPGIGLTAVAQGRPYSCPVSDSSPLTTS